jgi:hypothetical protein
MSALPSGSVLKEDRQEEPVRADVLRVHLEVFLVITVLPDVEEYG